MKILTNTSNAQIDGDIQSNKIGIDIKNVDFITQILSTNLYSRPIESFLREAISNARDAHMEAGTTDPIVLDIGMNQGKLYIRIQDFGTGVTKQRFNEIYRFIGSSTKRDTNAYIGGFGIGRFAALAVSDTVYITSICEGYKTQYLMYRDGTSIKIDELSSVQSNDKNGLEILAYIKGTNYRETFEQLNIAIQNLAFFQGVYVNCSLNSNLFGSDYYAISRLSTLRDTMAAFNTRSITAGSTYKVCNIHRDRGVFALLGDVVYPIDKQIINNYILDKNSGYSSCSVGICFNIGELSVTPNREGLIYDYTTTEAIKKKLQAFEQEIASKVASTITLQNGISSDILSDEVNTLLCSNHIVYAFNPNNKININRGIVLKQIAINGNTYSERIWEMVRQIACNTAIGTVRLKTYYRKTFSSSTTFTIASISNRILKRINGNLKSSVADYLRNTYRNINVAIISLFDGKQLKDILTQQLSYIPSASEKADYSTAFNLVLEIFKPLYDQITVLTEDTIPDSYKKTKKTAQTYSGEITLTTYRGCYTSRTKGTIRELFRSDILYYSVNTEDIPLLEIFSKESHHAEDFKVDDYAYVQFISVAAANKSLIKDLPNVRPITDLLTKNLRWAEVALAYSQASQNKNFAGKFSPANIYKNTSIASYKSIMQKYQDATQMSYRKDTIALAQNTTAKADMTLCDSVILTDDEIFTYNFLKSDSLTAQTALYKLLIADPKDYDNIVKTIKTEMAL